jgi:sec-independent protein translocase protein TatB
MIDFGFDKIALIGAVALIVIGPEKLPRVARTVGHFVGKAQRYVADVKAEVNRSIELEELQKMKREFETAAKDVQDTVKAEVDSATQSFENEWQQAQTAYDGDSGGFAHTPLATPPLDARPKKNWRLKRSAMPAWYKQRHGVRARALSGAARVAKYRPKPVSKDI